MIQEVLEGLVDKSGNLAIYQIVFRNKRYLVAVLNTITFISKLRNCIFERGSEINGHT